MLYHQFHAMSTTILAAARGDARQVREGFSQAESLVRRMEALFTRFDERSELCALNRSGGEWFSASDSLYEATCLAQQAYFETGGLFNPAVLEALESAGYGESIETRPLDRPRRLNREKPAATAPDFGATRFDPAGRRILMPPGLRIDLGGIAKGWIAKQAARLLSGYTDGCVVDAGGDLFACGSPAEGQLWQVGLEDPFEPARDLAVLNIQSGAVATSSISRRRWKAGGMDFHHIIDPRSGLPAEAFWVSVTAICPRAADAEALAKALLIAGPAGAANLLSRRPDAVYIAIDMHRHVWGSPKSEGVLNAKFLDV